MLLTEVRCHNCGAPIDGANISFEQRMARCSPCGSVFALTFPSSSGDQSAAELNERLPVDQPKGLTVESSAGRLILRRRWLSTSVIIMTFFTVMWNGFMVVWHAIALGSGIWIMSAFGLLHTAVGAYLLFRTLAGWLNTTEISVDRETLAITHSPIPASRGVTLAAGRIRQLYCREKVHRGRNSVSYTYTLRAVLDDGTQVTLLKDLPTTDAALFVEQKIEAFLGIEDRVVRGELARG